MEPPPRRAPNWVLIVVVLGIVGGVVVVRLPPWSFLTRDDLPSCGKVAEPETVGQAPEGLDCLQAAHRTGTGAELVVTGWSVEGPVGETYYRVLPGREGLELFVHNDDPYGGPEGWAHTFCPEATTVPDVGPCHAS